ncbi:hypothetical protein [Camelimonas lactis]|uniref:Uncharacterized protein n=1 Tax=Camelimonas lactis TaxID=659006 RepID=A0A4R2GRI8_9HYPH|nr:hypothetical protein [Camelimonas lactis]TCO12417.1 hypothetical protein EV666_10964 [Camelimonas lactis]
MTGDAKKAQFDNEQTSTLAKLRFASTWAVLAMNNLAAYERQTGRAVTDDQIVGYVSAGKAEGMYILAGDVRLLADAVRAATPSADTFAGTVDTDTELQAAAREAGWALQELINEIDSRKRPQVDGIITRLGLALEALPAAQKPTGDQQS